jgi:branched-chain amino acid transport system ATP-binding protein
MNVLLDVKDVSVHFGGVRALQAVSFQVFENELLSLIGPNGAGKTTMLRAIIGAVSSPNARIQLDGRELSPMPTHRRAQLGLALTHQIVRPFKSMTLLDNVALAAGHRRIRRVFRSMVSVNRDPERNGPPHYWNWWELPTMPDRPWRASLWVSSNVWKWPGRWRWNLGC